MALAGTLSPFNMKVATLLCSISQKKASVFPVQYDVKYGSGICCLLYVEVYFFYTQQIEFLTWKDVTFCQRLFLSILNKHLIMLIECITCWKSLHQSQIAWQKVFPMFYQAQFPHTFSIFCYIYFGREACMCRGVPVEVRGQIEEVGSFLQLHGFWRSNSVIRQGNDTLSAEPSHWPSVHIFGQWLFFCIHVN